jgi:molybdopterin-guanine dinucleotide biosynthesis protein B
MTPVVAFSGPSGVGKTTLLVKLIPALRARGLAIAALKRSGHPHPFDRPGKDSARLRAAGAAAVALSGPHELAYFGPPVRALRALVRMLPRVDLVVAEGFKTERVPRVEVHRKAISREFLCARDRKVIAVVSDEEPPRPVPRFEAGDIEGLADFLARLAFSGRRARGRALAASRAGGQGVAREEEQVREMPMATRSSRRGGARAKSSRSTRRGSASVREAGRKGGRRTLERRGPEFYSRIGRKGGKSSGTARAAKSAAGRGRATTRTSSSRSRSAGGKRAR